MRTLTSSIQMIIMSATKQYSLNLFLLLDLISHLHPPWNERSIYIKTSSLINPKLYVTKWNESKFYQTYKGDR